MFRSKQNRRKSTLVFSPLARVYLAVAAEHVVILALLIAGQTHAHAQTPTATPIPRPAPPAQPAIPAGLVIGSRQIDRQDIGEYFSHYGIAQPFPAIPGSPAASERNAANVAAFTPQGKRGHIARSFAPLWLDSPQASQISVSLGEGALSLDAIQAAADVVSVRVHDEQGGSVTVSQRVYRTNGQAESLDATVRVDEAGRLLALPVVRLEENKDGSVIVTRDSGFAEALSVEYRLVRTGTSPHAFTPTQIVYVPAGAATSAPLAIQAKAGDVLTLRAGNGYTPAPLEDSDVIQFE